MGVALDVPAAHVGWLSNELSCLPGSLLVWVHADRIEVKVAGAPRLQVLPQEVWG